MKWTILCDFDGTIAVEDVTDSVLSRFAPPGWEVIEADWLEGRIGSRECMRRQIEMIEATKEELDAHLDEIAIDPDFARFVTLAEESDIPVTVVSDGLDYAIRRILGRHGLDRLPIVANRLEQVGKDRYRLGFPYTDESCLKACGTCKCKVAGEKATSRPMRLLVGDGTSDMCAAGAVDLVFAKDKLLDYCRAEGLPALAYRHFGEAKGLLSILISEPVRLGVALAAALAAE